MRFYFAKTDDVKRLKRAEKMKKVPDEEKKERSVV